MRIPAARDGDDGDGDQPVGNKKPKPKAVGNPLAVIVGCGMALLAVMMMGVYFFLRK